jgi:hypothetical protein
MTTEPMNTASDSGPFAIIPEWLVLSSLSHGAVRLYALLGLYADWKDGVAWPSRNTLARDLKVSKDSIDRWVKELTDAGALMVERRLAPLEGDSEVRMNQTSLYTVIRIKQEGGRTRAARGKVAPRGGRIDAARGGGKDAALTRTNKELEPKEQENTRHVFNHWVDVTGRDRSRTKLDPKRKKLIEWALSNYSLEEVLLAVQGWKFSNFHRGENKEKRVYNDLALLLRDTTKLEMFRDLAKRGDVPTTPEVWDRLKGFLDEP